MATKWKVYAKITEIKLFKKKIYIFLETSIQFNRDISINIK